MKSSRQNKKLDKKVILVTEEDQKIQIKISIKSSTKPNNKRQIKNIDRPQIVKSKNQRENPKERRITRSTSKI